METKITILYLDDESHNLSAFKASFRRTFNVHIANTANEAIEIIEKENPQIVIADHRMPLVTGVEFFEKIKTEFPDPIRILLTAYTSSQTVIDAINKGHIDRYMMKPWDFALMESTLKSCIEIYNTRVELRLKVDELKRTNDELNRFVYSVSHDLRAPLMSMLGLVHLVKAGMPEDELLEYYNLMEKSIKKMDNHIQATLEYYRNFKSEVTVEKIHVNELLSELVESMKVYSDLVRINVTIPDGTHIQTDKMRLRIALSNLLSNAIKYGQKNDQPFNVDITVSPSDNDLKIAVQDYGIGIQKNELSRIFEMFYRTADNKNTKSTGLGLYLVKDALDKIKGKVDVTSEVGEGTCFTLFIPHLPIEEKEEKEMD
jgi:signal transduction histidine kinase